MDMDTLTAPLLKELIGRIDVSEVQGRGKYSIQCIASITALWAIWRWSRITSRRTSNRIPAKALLWSMCRKRRVNENNKLLTPYSYLKREKQNEHRYKSVINARYGGDGGTRTPDLFDVSEAR